MSAFTAEQWYEILTVINHEVAHMRAKINAPRGPVHKVTADNADALDYSGVPNPEYSVLWEENQNLRAKVKQHERTIATLYEMLPPAEKAKLIDQMLYDSKAKS